MPLKNGHYLRNVSLKGLMRLRNMFTLHHLNYASHLMWNAEANDKEKKRTQTNYKKVIHI